MSFQQKRYQSQLIPELEMFERLENTANNKFRKVAENELKEIYKNIIQVQLDKSNTLEFLQVISGHQQYSFPVNIFI